MNSMSAAFGVQIRHSASQLEIQEALRDDLKVIVMSATLDQQALQSLLPEAKYVESQGRTFPAKSRYQPLGTTDYLAPKWLT
ncbi:hypothetical protein OK016_05825 [Vibrio chagasii]|nr:hypothetical protein [Vibrio chagasii]